VIVKNLISKIPNKEYKIVDKKDWSRYTEKRTPTIPETIAKKLGRFNDE
jgi:hypothetical protein